MCIAVNALYSPVVEFLLLKPSVDITNIPEFYKLFNSSAADVSLFLRHKLMFDLFPSNCVVFLFYYIKLSACSLLQFHAERLWMLSLMEDGLREPSDFHLYEKRYAFKLLLSLYESSMSDADVQVCFA